MNIIILALIAALQKEVVLLEAELAQQQATTTVNVAPYVAPVQPIQTNYLAPVQTPVLTAAPQPSCTLSVDYLNSPVNVSWNVQNATTFIPSMQWKYTTNGVWSDWTPMLLAPTYVPPHDPTQQVFPETTQTSTVTGLNLINDQGSSRLEGMVGQTAHYPIDVQLSMGGATCDYIIK